MENYLLVALVLFGLGIVLIGMEFVIPTGGIILMGAVLLFAVAVGLVLIYGETVQATVAVTGFCLGVPAVGWLLLQTWKGMALKQTLGPDGKTNTEPLMPEWAELETLRGKTGLTVTPMRPSGTVEIDGRRVDAMTEGQMLDANIPVKCIDVRAGQVRVRKIEVQAPLADFDMNDLK